jgi:hypothetical protein
MEGGLRQAPADAGPALAALQDGRVFRKGPLPAPPAYGSLREMLLGGGAWRDGAGSDCEGEDCVVPPPDFPYESS